MTAYYNEFDPFAAAWLRNLIAAGLIANGEVDERSIKDVHATDLVGYVQHHFFAGIGGWSYALRFAGWPDDSPVWTGSCPCQPISVAGRQAAETDERHLWPDFYGLIEKCRPPAIFGEQVAGKVGLEWFAGVQADLEELEYAVGGADLCAAGVGAPHIRQRLYWVGYAERSERGPISQTCGFGGKNAIPQWEKSSGWLGSTGSISSANRLGHASRTGLQEQWREYRPSGERCSGLIGSAVQINGFEWNGPTVAIECSDGYRRISTQPDAFPMAHGIPNRVGTLRGSGNAIVPQKAAEFIKVCMEYMP